MLPLEGHRFPSSKPMLECGVEDHPPEKGVVLLALDLISDFLDLLFAEDFFRLESDSATRKCVSVDPFESFRFSILMREPLLWTPDTPRNPASGDFETFYPIF